MQLQLRLQHGKSATWKKGNMEKVQHEKSATWKSATWKECDMETVPHEKRATLKKYNMEKARHGKSPTWKSATWETCDMEIVEAYPESREHLRWRTLQLCLTALIIIVVKFSILDVCRDPGNTSGKCNRKKLQHPKNATGGECKTNTLQRVKVQHEIEQLIKSVEHKKKCSMETLLHKKVQHGNGAVWKKCNMKRLQHEKRVTLGNINCHSEVRKKCTKILHYRAQSDNGSSVDGPL